LDVNGSERQNPRCLTGRLSGRVGMVGVEPGRCR
jgi:hypothetical protein